MDVSLPDRQTGEYERGRASRSIGRSDAFRQKVNARWWVIGEGFDVLPPPLEAYDLYLHLEGIDEWREINGNLPKKPL